MVTWKVSSASVLEESKTQYAHTSAGIRGCVFQSSSGKWGWDFIPNNGVMSVGIANTEEQAKNKVESLLQEEKKHANIQRSV